MTPFVLTRDLCKTYQKGTVSIPVLQGVFLDVEKGEYVSVVGRSGSGESKLLNLSGGLYPVSRAARVDPVQALRHD